MHRILSVGQDPDLLNTRSAVLGMCNAGVISASAFSAVEILRAQPFDLVVLCHTLSSKERNELAVAARQRYVKVLDVLGVAERCERSAVDDMVEPNPNALVEKVAEMLGDAVRVS